MKSNKRYWFPTIAVTFAAVAMLVAQQASRAQATASLAPKIVMTGVIRCVGGVFEPLDDAGHQPFGISSVQTLSDRVRVNYTTTLSAYGTAFADPDETYVVNNINTGASGGYEYMDIFIAKGGAKIAPSSACISGSNIWVEAKGY